MTARRPVTISKLLALLLLLNLTAYTGRGQETDEPGKIRIASWNIRYFSDGSRDDTELNQICQILTDYDFVAIVELRNEQVLQRTESMLQTMGKDYDYQISHEVGTEDRKERYAFLYDAAKVELVKAGDVFPDPDNVFIREPYYASFKAGEFDFTAIAIHVIWGDTVGGRRAEIQELADVFNQIQDADLAEQDVILVGDFNREPDDDKAFGKLRDIPSTVNLFNLPEKSHIRDSRRCPLRLRINVMTKEKKDAKLYAKNA